MVPTTLLDSLRRHGLSLKLQGDQILVRPPHAVTDRIATLIRYNRDRLIQLLRQELNGSRPGVADRRGWPGCLAEAFDRFEFAGLQPRPVLARGDRNVTVTALVARCPLCCQTESLELWPLASGRMAGVCRTGCHLTLVLRHIQKALTVEQLLTTRRLP